MATDFYNQDEDPAMVAPRFLGTAQALPGSVDVVDTILRLRAMYDPIDPLEVAS